MLSRLIIKNLAIVSEAEIEFDEGLNVLSGETGAGKSIIVDALMLLMGSKYDRTMLSYGAAFGYVEGTFTFESEDMLAKIREYDIEPDDGTVIVRRKFHDDGKNEIKVNGISFTAGMLRSFMGVLVDICGQNEYQVLTRKKEHLSLLDAYSGSEMNKRMVGYGQLYAELQDIDKKLSMIGNTQERLTRLDLLKYQIDEIEKAGIEEGEEEELLSERSKVQHYEKIRANLSNALDLLGGEGGAAEKTSSAERSLSAISGISEEYMELSARIASLRIELDDVSDGINEMLGDMDSSEFDLDAIENRLALLRNIRNKYGDLDKIKGRLARMKEEFKYLSNADEEYEELMQDRDKVLTGLYEEANAISKLRREKAVMFEDDVMNELSELGFLHAEFSVSFRPYPSSEDFEQYLGKNGFDDVEFLLSPNPGQPLLPLIKIISGGEMSRLMLALKVISSRYSNVSTIIFDEIDTGISGKIGQEIAKKLAKIAVCTQVLCVTHLPQIASMADQHFFIEKISGDSSTETIVTKLGTEGMIGEISRLSGAGDVSSVSFENAREMKEWASRYKSSL